MSLADFPIKLRNLSILNDCVLDLLEPVDQWLGDHKLVSNFHKTYRVILQTESSGIEKPQGYNIDGNGKNKVNSNILRLVYFANFHSISSCGIIF